MDDVGASLTVLASTGPGGSGLVRTLAEVPPGGSHAGAAGAGGELWFVIEGSGRLGLDSVPGPELVPDRGLLVPPGANYQVHAGSADGLRLDIVSLPAAIGLTEGETGAAASGASLPLCRDLADCEVETTGDRRFRVLFGPGRDCAVATQFLGEIPPGRAPQHSHPYDEVVLILQGTGVAHAGDVDRELAPGSCLHLPPGVPHCLENTGQHAMRVLGVFHPADSPAAKLHGSPAGRG